jgi:class 3 adenylate cyclase
MLTYADTVVMGLLSAAAFPDRLRSLVCVDGYPRLTVAPDYPCGLTPEQLQLSERYLDATWGTGQMLERIAPELASDGRFRAWYARFERSSYSPAIFRKVRQLVREVDLRGVLPSVQAPVLVTMHADQPFVSPDNSRYLARALPNARLVERPGVAGVAWLHDADGVADEVEKFLVGSTSRHAVDMEDRYLATVLFTDIVESTSRAAAMGDTAWAQLLDDHHRVMTHTITRFRGQLLKSTGDGVLATFDGPARAIRCGLAMRDAAAQLGLDLRVGLHTGEVERRADDIRGIAVAIAARVLGEAVGGEVLVSGAVPPLVAGSGLAFEDGGIRPLKGVPGDWRVLSVRETAEAATV